MNVKTQLQAEILKLEKKIEKEQEKTKREQDEVFIKEIRDKMTMKQLEFTVKNNLLELGN